jgi:hypothetical protein
VVDEQAAHVFHPQAVWFLSSASWLRGISPVASRCEQVADAGLAEPGEDAFGALGSAERASSFVAVVSDPRDIVDAQQDAEVVPK